MSEFTTDFADACNAYRSARAEVLAVDARTRAGWEANPDWRISWDLHADMMAKYPSEIVAEVIDSMYPGLQAKIDLITRHRDTHIQLRDAAYDAMHVAKIQALDLMGQHFGQQVVETNPELQELRGAVEHAYLAADALRKISLDGMSLRFESDMDGPFTKSLYAKIAEYLDIPVRGKRWTTSVMNTLRAGADPKMYGI